MPHIKQAHMYTTFLSSPRWPFLSLKVLGFSTLSLKHWSTTTISREKEFQIDPVSIYADNKSGGDSFIIPISWGNCWSALLVIWDKGKRKNSGGWQSRQRTRFPI